MKHQRISPEQANEIRLRHAAGESIYALGAAFRVAPQTIARTVAFEIHRPRDRRVVPVLISRRDYALLAFRAEERGTPMRDLAAEILARGLATA